MEEPSSLEEQLMDAVGAEDTARVQLLLDAGADAKHVNRYEDGMVWSYLDCAVSGPLEILRLLIQHGASADACIGEDGDSPLHKAADKGDPDVIQLLLDSGASQCLHTFDYIEHTPLHYAAKQEHFAAVKLLLKAGADINAHDADKLGETALGAVAETCGYAMAKLLCDAGANPWIKGWMWNTAYSRASDREDGEGKRVFALLAQAAESFLPRSVEELSEIDEVAVTVDIPEAGIASGTFGRFWGKQEDGLYHLHLQDATGNWQAVNLRADQFRPMRVEEMPHRRTA